VVGDQWQGFAAPSGATLTSYDLLLPYRTPELEWKVGGELVNMIHIGHDDLREQVMFSENSMRGSVTVQLLDREPKEGSSTGPVDHAEHHAHTLVTGSVLIRSTYLAPKGGQRVRCPLGFARSIRDE
jgi:hypothetical protein